jgi:putative ABC transport system permease protein
MKLSDIFEETYAALLVNKVRSGLTVLGIVIGIGSVIAMISVGQGAQGTIQSSIQSLGSNLIIVMPGAQSGPGVQVSTGRGSAQSLTQDDATAIGSEVSDVQGVTTELSGQYQVTAKGTNTRTRVTGVGTSYASIRNITVADGSFIADQEISSAAKVAVIGPTVRDDLFGVDGEAVGQTIRIKQVAFTIIGVTAAKGGTGFGSSDDMIYVPLSTAQRYLAGGTGVSDIYVQATDQQVMTQVQADITTLLLERHHITDPTKADFSTLNQTDIIAAASSITSTFTLLLGCVAGISLVVGGIGIMNMMLTAVTERTREIGLRKAVGAKRWDISSQFLAEALMLTFVGGAVGVVLGWLIALIISHFGGITTSVSLFSVLLAFGVSATIGIVFGYYPAQRAARLNPIEALRYE